jgi:hypothetical protein
MKQCMKNYENPLGTKITSNLTALSLFFERNQFLEPTLVFKLKVTPKTQHPTPYSPSHCKN